MISGLQGAVLLQFQCADCLPRCGCAAQPGFPFCLPGQQPAHSQPPLISDNYFFRLRTASAKAGPPAVAELRASDVMTGGYVCHTFTHWTRMGHAGSVKSMMGSRCWSMIAKVAVAFSGVEAVKPPLLPGGGCPGKGGLPIGPLQ